MYIYWTLNQWNQWKTFFWESWGGDGPPVPPNWRHWSCSDDSEVSDSSGSSIVRLFRCMDSSDCSEFQIVIPILIQTNSSDSFDSRILPIHTPIVLIHAEYTIEFNELHTCAVVQITLMHAARGLCISSESQSSRILNTRRRWAPPLANFNIVCAVSVNVSYQPISVYFPTFQI